MQLYKKTALRYSPSLSDHLNCNVYLKMEIDQPTGSFKDRGMSALCSLYRKEGFTGVLSPSGGNAGLATARSARLLGLKAHIHLSKSSKAFMIERLLKEGAEISMSEESEWDLVYSEGHKLAKELQFGFVSPFDHSAIWEGNSSMIEEIIDEGVNPDAVVLSVGGGGLFAGAAIGLKRRGLLSTAIIAVETEGAASFYASLKEHHVVFVNQMKTVASSLAVKKIAEGALELAERCPTRPLLVTDEEAKLAVKRFALEERRLIEPATGVALAPLYERRKEICGFKEIVVIICGGNLISEGLFG